ncbi:hypothetical protein [Microvirga thermotolerans]|uniref:Uncharacterized protein n=1 Tax=Microvirga thermotolerans TaxID=2651334 RepID=A0A5P9JQC5_9HYPH|nr:hypothetical protein [Microvirga thermotolerans]QFU14837.1 hypothetical protein GDR74_00640 [Microvirga thermotolerans]
MIDLEFRNVWEDFRAARAYSPDLLPRLQSALADLADLDVTYRRNLESLSRADGDENLKRELAERLKQQYEVRREPCLRELAALEERIATEMGPADA